MSTTISWERCAGSNGLATIVERGRNMRLSPAQQRGIAISALTGITVISADFAGGTRVFERLAYLVDIGRSRIDYVGLFEPAFEPEEQIQLPRLCVRRGIWASDNAQTMSAPKGNAAQVLAALDCRTWYLAKDRCDDIVGSFEKLRQLVVSGIALDGGTPSSATEYIERQIWIGCDETQWSLAYVPSVRDVSSIVDRARLELWRSMDTSKLADDFEPDFGTHRVSGDFFSVDKNFHLLKDEIA